MTRRWSGRIFFKVLLVMRLNKRESMTGSWSVGLPNCLLAIKTSASEKIDEFFLKGSFRSFSMTNRCYIIIFITKKQ